MEKRAFLKFGLVLLSVYFSIVGAKGIIHGFPALLEIRSSFGFFHSIAQPVQLILGLALVFRPKALLRVISANKSFNTDTGDTGAAGEP